MKDTARRSLRTSENNWVWKMMGATCAYHLFFSLNKPNLFSFYTYSVFDDPGRAYMGSVFPRIIILIDIWALMTDLAWLIATRARRSRPFSGSDPYDEFPGHPQKCEMLRMGRGRIQIERTPKCLWFTCISRTCATYNKTDFEHNMCDGIDKKRISQVKADVERKGTCLLGCMTSLVRNDNAKRKSNTRLDQYKYIKTYTPSAPPLPAHYPTSQRTRY